MLIIKQKKDFLIIAGMSNFELLKSIVGISIIVQIKLYDKYAGSKQ